MSYSSYGSAAASWQERLEGKLMPLEPIASADNMQRNAAKLRSTSQSSKSCLIDEVSFHIRHCLRKVQLAYKFLGGRTAWSSTVTVQGQNISARFWYDGEHINNAKEDAAEVALKHLTGSNPSSPSQSRRGW